MKMYTYSEARDRFAAVLEEARTQEVVIRRRNGDQFTISHRQVKKSPLDVPPIQTQATTEDILDALRECRERG